MLGLINKMVFCATFVTAGPTSFLAKWVGCRHCHYMLMIFSQTHQLHTLDVNGIISLTTVYSSIMSMRVSYFNEEASRSASLIGSIKNHD